MVSRCTYRGKFRSPSMLGDAYSLWSGACGKSREISLRPCSFSDAVVYDEPRWMAAELQLPLLRLTEPSLLVRRAAGASSCNATPVHLGGNYARRMAVSEMSYLGRRVHRPPAIWPLRNQGPLFFVLFCYFKGPRSSQIVFYTDLPPSHPHPAQTHKKTFLKEKVYVRCSRFRTPENEIRKFGK